MDCESCNYSKTEYQFTKGHELQSRTLFCYMNPPTPESSNRVNVTQRLAPCFRHMAQTPLDEFNDLLPALEAMIPDEFMYRGEHTPAMLIGAPVASDMLFSIFLMFEQKGYPLSPKLLNYMSEYQEIVKYRPEVEK